MTAFDNTSFITIIGIVILTTFYIRSSWCITDQSFNMNGVSLVFITYPIVFQMRVLFQEERNSSSGLGFFSPTKYSNKKRIKMAKLCQYWPELDAATFKKRDTINVYMEMYSITLSLT